MPIPDLPDCPILVTGGAGFIGSHLVEGLVARGARVRVLDDLSSGRRENLRAVWGEIEFVRADVRDLAACRAAVAGVRYVAHLAAQVSVAGSLADPAGALAVNVLGTANVCAAAREVGVERLVYASSSAVYGDAKGQPQREGKIGRPLSPYALAKRLSEEIGAHFSAALGLATVGLRFFNVYGPRQDPEGPYAAVIPRFFAACLAGEAPVIYGDGAQTRDFVYVDDVVSALLAALAAGEPAAGKTFNVASGLAVSVADLAELVRATTSRGQPARHEPARVGEVRHSCGDPDAAAELLGFRATTTLADGLARSQPWFSGLKPRPGAE